LPPEAFYRTDYYQRPRGEEEVQTDTDDADVNLQTSAQQVTNLFQHAPQVQRRQRNERRDTEREHPSHKTVELQTHAIEYFI
jgi:hypothetical protein